MATITIKESGPTAGVWASTGGATVGLVAQDGVGPYLCCYAKGQSFPGLALFVGTDGEARIQLPGKAGIPGGRTPSVRQIKISDLLAKTGRRRPVPVLLREGPILPRADGLAEGAAGDRRGEHEGGERGV